MTTTENIKIVKLPRTFAAIRREFPGDCNESLRAELRRAACFGDVRPLARRIALTASGKAALTDVQSVLDYEYRHEGYAGIYVGEGDPQVYGEGVIVAYLDQPAANA